MSKDDEVPPEAADDSIAAAKAHPAARSDRYSEVPPKAAELPSELAPEVASPETINTLGLITDPNAFNVAWSESQRAILLVFPQEDKTTVLGFGGNAGEKLLTSMVVLVKLLLGTGTLERKGEQTFEVPEKEKLTLH